MTPDRARLLAMLDDEIAAAEATTGRLRQMRALLTEGRPTRQFRNYDAPPLSGEEIAAMHGITLHPADDVDTTPAWFRERHRAIGAPS